MATVRRRFDAAESTAPIRSDLRAARAAVGVLVVSLVVTAALVVAFRERHAFEDALRRLGPWNTLASFALGVLGIGLTCPSWRAVMAGLGVELPASVAARVYFVSQLGKYLPGSVWPVLMQMEAGRARGATRRTMLIGNLFSLVLGCATGLVLACVLLPLTDSSALSHYWWLFIALAFLVPLLHPRAMPAVINQVMRLLHAQPTNQQLPARSTVRAFAYTVACYLALGAHVGLLAVAVGGGGFSTFVLCTGGMALALPAGVLFVPAPSGAGVRDVILALVLSQVLDTGQALAVIVASRVLLVAADLLLAAGGTGMYAITARSRPAAS